MNHASKDRSSSFFDRPATGWDWGNLELMNGKIAIQFTPIAGTGLIARLGRNATNLTEIKDLTENMPVSDIRRTVRILLR